MAGAVAPPSADLLRSRMRLNAARCCVRIAHVRCVLCSHVRSAFRFLASSSWHPLPPPHQPVLLSCVVAARSSSDSMAADPTVSPPSWPRRFMLCCTLTRRAGKQLLRTSSARLPSLPPTACVAKWATFAGQGRDGPAHALACGETRSATDKQMRSAGCVLVSTDRDVFLAVYSTV